MPSCAAYGCTNNAQRNPCKGVSFFKFPMKNSLLLKTWLIKIRRDNFTPSPYSLLCSDHFEETCFQYQPFTHRRQLKPGAIPTIFVFTKNSPLGKVTNKRKPQAEISKPSTSTKGDMIIETEEIQSGREINGCEPCTSAEADVAIGTEAIQLKKEINACEPCTSAVGTEDIQSKREINVCEACTSAAADMAIGTEEIQSKKEINRCKPSTSTKPDVALETEEIHSGS